MSNLKFTFLYRDAANYKTFGEVVFANPEDIEPEVFQKLLVQACNHDACFDPRPWGLPNIRTQPYEPELDHNWYEFASVEETKEPPTEARSLTMFLQLLKAKPHLSAF